MVQISRSKEAILHLLVAWNSETNAGGNYYKIAPPASIISPPPKIKE